MTRLKKTLPAPPRRVDLSDRLIHLTHGDPPTGTKVGNVIQDRAALAAFLSIVRSGRLIAGNRNIRGGYKCICFSEAPASAIAQMVANRDSRYAPLGVMVDKIWLFSKGGRPVIYQPEREYEALPEPLRYRHVRYDPVKGTDLTWEREWRLRKDELRLEPAATTLVVPSRAIADHFREEHFRDLKQTAIRAGEYARFAMKEFPWHFLVLEDLGLDIAFG
jgi:hypothetical protein